MNFILLNQTHRKLWCDFTKNHNNNNIFQSYDFYEAHLSFDNFRPIAFGLYSNEKIIGIISGIIQSNYFFPISRMTERLIVIGGPLIQDDCPKLTEYFLKKVNKFLSKKVVYTQFRNLWIQEDNVSNAFISNGFTYEPHLDIIHNLDISLIDMYNKIKKNKRGNINKSINKGTIFYEIHEIEEYIQSIKLIIKSYKEIGLPCPTFNYFIEIHNKLFQKGILKVFAAKYNSEIIGVRLELCYNKIIYDWYAGANLKFKSKYPNDFLPYKILEWGINNDFSKFDFGGAGKPNIKYGVRYHKIKFGGNLVEYGRFSKINKKLFYSVGKIGIKYLKKFL